MALRAGFLGGGNITDTHARAAVACRSLEIAAFHGQNREKTERLAARYGGRAYAHLDDFLAHRPMDLVVIGSPSGLHAEQGIAAAQRGLHVLVEKPIDVTTARADALVEAAERAGVHLAVIFQDRLQPEVVRLRGLLQDGALGRVLLVSARVKWYRPREYYAESRWRGTLALDGGGALINQGIHTVDLLQWLLGPVTRVQGRTARCLHAIEAEDTTLALLEFESGVVGTLEATTCAWPGYPRRVEITGTAGTVVLEGNRIAAADLKAPREAMPSLGDSSATDETTPVVADALPHQRALEDFARAVETGGPPACDGGEGRRSLAIVEAIYAAARSGRAELVQTRGPR